MRYRRSLGTASLDQGTLRDFSGGLNSADSDLNLDTRFAVSLRNMIVGDDGSLATRHGVYGFTNFNATVGSARNIGQVSDWGVYNADLTIGASASVSTTDGESYVDIDFDHNHGLVTGNWIKGISTATSSNLGNIPYTEFNDSQWRCIEKVDDTTVRVFTDTAANATTSVSTVAATKYCNKTALMLPQGEMTLGMVGGWYFQNRIILVDRVGVVYAVDGQGNIEIVFNDPIAAGLSGNPRGWRPLAENGTLISVVSAYLYKGSLIINNGLDKPIEVYESGGSLVANYLVDEGTGSNANTPIGNFSVVLNQFVCIAGDPLNPNIVHIGAKGTKGTFVDDPAPNDAVQLFVDEFTESYDNEITGLGAFRGRLVVFMRNSALIFTLGQYDSNGNHIPQYVETLFDTGCSSPRTIRKIGDELFATDSAGINSLRQSRFINSVEPARASDLIRETVLKSLDHATNDALFEDAFAQTDRRQRLMIVRLPRWDESYELGNGVTLTTSQGSARIEAAFSKSLNIRTGDTITLYDFGTNKNIELTPIDGLKQYIITGVSEDGLTAYFNADQEADSDGLFSTISARSSMLYVSNTSDPLVCERKDLLIALKIVPTAKIFAWQEFDGLEAFGELRSAVITELNNLFWVFDYHVMLSMRDFETEHTDGVDFVGQNWHDEAWLNSSGDRIYKPRQVTFKPSGNAETITAVQYQSVDPDTYENETASGFDSYTDRPIEFEWESPWIDFGNRQSIKEVAFIAIDSEGNGRFTVEAYTDLIYQDEFGERKPALSLQFDAGGLKLHHVYQRSDNSIWIIDTDSDIESGTVIAAKAIEPVTTVRRASSQLLHTFPCQFKTLKLRIFGDTAQGPIKIVGVSLYRREGRLVGS